MNRWNVGALGMRMLSRPLRKWLNVPQGLLLMRAKHIPWCYKLLAFGLGALITALLMALELPVESLLATLLIGLPIDISVDGLEAILGPLVFGSALLPLVLPRQLLQE